MHLGCATHLAWKHLACGNWRLEVTEASDARSLLFQPSSFLLEPSSLSTGLKQHPDCLRDGWMSAMLLHLHRLTAASMHLATTTGGSTRRSRVLPVSVISLEVDMTFQSTLLSVQRSAAAGPLTTLQGRAELMTLSLA